MLRRAISYNDENTINNLAITAISYNENTINNLAITANELARFIVNKNNKISYEEASVMANNIISFTENEFPLPSAEMFEQSAELGNLFANLSDIGKLLKEEIDRLNDYLRDIKNTPTLLNDADFKQKILSDIKEQRIRTGFGPGGKFFIQSAFKDPVGGVQKLSLSFNLLLDAKREVLRQYPCQPNFIEKLKKLSLELYSKFCVQELQEEKGGMHIIHFYEKKFPDSPKQAKYRQGYNLDSPRQAEYHQGYDSDEEDDRSHFSFNQTSHGIGSGVYGVAILKEGDVKKGLSRNFRTVLITKPLRLSDHLLDDDEYESDVLTRVSKSMQRIADTARESQIRQNKKKADSPSLPKLSRSDALNAVLKENPDMLTEIVEDLLRISAMKEKDLDDGSLRQMVVTSIDDFLESARASQKKEILITVPAPINFLMKRLGYNGVVSKLNDSFSRGLIAFDPVGSELWPKVPVKAIFHNKNLRARFFDTATMSTERKIKEEDIQKEVIRSNSL